MWLFFILVAVPIIEIALFIQIGGAIGLWPTLLIVVITAFVGTVLLRSQGLATLSRLQGSLQTGDNPTDLLAHGALILVAGIVLLTPGFFTDALGLSLLLPPVRAAAIRFLAARITTGGIDIGQTGQTPPPSEDIIEGEFDVTSDKPGQSGWTRPNE